MSGRMPYWLRTIATWYKKMVYYCRRFTSRNTYRNGRKYCKYCTVKLPIELKKDKQVALQEVVEAHLAKCDRARKEKKSILPVIESCNNANDLQDPSKPDDNNNVNRLEKVELEDSKGNECNETSRVINAKADDLDSKFENDSSSESRDDDDENTTTERCLFGFPPEPPLSVIQQMQQMECSNTLAYGMTDHMTQEGSLSTSIGAHISIPKKWPENASPQLKRLGIKRQHLTQDGSIAHLRVGHHKSRGYEIEIDEKISRLLQQKLMQKKNQHALEGELLQFYENKDYLNELDLKFYHEELHQNKLIWKHEEQQGENDFNSKKTIQIDPFSLVGHVEQKVVLVWDVPEYLSQCQVGSNRVKSAACSFITLTFLELVWNQEVVFPRLEDGKDQPMPIGLLHALHEAIVDGNRAHLTASDGDALMLHNFSKARDCLQSKLIETKFQCKEHANVERDLPPMLLKAIEDHKLAINHQRIYFAFGFRRRAMALVYERDKHLIGLCDSHPTNHRHGATMATCPADRLDVLAKWMCARVLPAYAYPDDPLAERLMLSICVPPLPMFDNVKASLQTGVTKMKRFVCKQSDQ